MYTFKSTRDILVLQRNSLTMYLVILKIQMTGPHYTSELMPTCTCMTSLCDLQMYIFLILCIHCTCNFAFIIYCTCTFKMVKISKLVEVNS